MAKIIAFTPRPRGSDEVRRPLQSGVVLILPGMATDRDGAGGIQARLRRVLRRRRIKKGDQ
jgi:hypothetical protein